MKIALLILLPILIYAQSIIFLPSPVQQKRLENYLSLDDLPHDPDSAIAEILRRKELHPLLKDVNFIHDSLTHTLLLYPAPRWIAYPEQPGFHLKLFKHGEDQLVPDAILSGGITFVNLFQTMETVTITGRLWGERNLGLSLRSPISWRHTLFIKSTIGRSYSETDPWDLTRYRAHTAGVEYYITPSLLSITEVEAKYQRYTQFPPEIVETYHEIVHSTSIIFRQLDRPFNPTRGVHYTATFKHNHIQPSPYGNYSHIIGDMRNFIPLFSDEHRFATLVRVEYTPFGELAPYQRLYLGGSSQLRGYSVGYIGGKHLYNNRLSIAGEYRFPIFKLQDQPLKFLNKTPFLSSPTPIHLDGALFIISGMLWHDMQNNGTSINDQEYGVSAGAGLRVVAPSMRAAGCVDLAFPLKSSKSKPDESFMLHLYLGLPF